MVERKAEPPKDTVAPGKVVAIALMVKPLQGFSRAARLGDCSLCGRPGRSSYGMLFI